jgi:hypothetical protein
MPDSQDLVTCLDQNFRHIFTYRTYQRAIVEGAEMQLGNNTAAQSKLRGTRAKIRTPNQSGITKHTRV